MHPELPYVAFIAALLVLVPLPWHWRARNVATLAMVAWLFVINVIYGVDAIIWSHNIRITALVWCDITSRIIIGAQMALPAACMCISVHLAQVASVSRVQNTKADKRRRQILELFFCFGIPVLWMGLHYTVQGHRFDIIEFYGCRPNTYISIPAILLVWVPPLIFSLITVIFSAIALIHFLRHRITFARLLENTSSGLTTSRYLRLMAMAFAEIVITVISTSVTLWFTTLSLRPWTNWADVHWNFSRIDTYPLALAPSMILNYYYAIWYIIPFSSLVFFVFFAFGQDAVKEYSACFVWVREHLFPCISCSSASGRVKGNPRPFASLPSASFVNGHSSLPSYRSAVGNEEAPPTPIEKEFIYKEHFAAQPIDSMGISPLPLCHIASFSDSSSCTSSTPPSPSHTAMITVHSFSESSDTIPTHTPVHPHSIV